ncbi:hypothetical protein OH786_01240 [Streptomyces atratus]|uniref:hypothetical protein n=1 Tax=Streptomyces atratus TaxID=1893 RepID=UPI0015A56B00|nr:hypothetical protein [Streptomyces atratus]
MANGTKYKVSAANSTRRGPELWVEAVEPVDGSTNNGFTGKGRRNVSYTSG